MKFVKRALFALIFIVITIIAYVFINVRSISVEPLAEGVFVLRGVGGNATVISTQRGTVVVDSMTFPMQGGLIRKKAEELTNAKVRLLINTHYHLDHTHGNPGFEPGTKVVSTENTLNHLKALDAKFWQGDAELLLPNDTFKDQRAFDMGDTTIRVLHPGRGHTDGDLVVFVAKHKLVVMGDLFFNQSYPNIDLEAGGSVQNWSDTLDRVFAEEFNLVVPGHGATTDRQGMKQFEGFIQELAELGRNARIEKLSLEQTIKQAELKSDKNYHELSFVGIPLGLNRRFVITRAWEEATGNFSTKD